MLGFLQAALLVYVLTCLEAVVKGNMAAKVTAIAGGEGIEANTTANIYGNDVIPRNNYVTTGGRKSWILSSTPLVTGHLNKFYLYAHYNAGGDRDVPIRLQIWRPIDGLAYELVYETEVRVDGSSPVGVYYIVDVISNPFPVMAGDVIGWSTNRDEGVISLSYVEGAITSFRNLDSEFPVVGQSYTFDQIPLPAVFSIAVNVSPAEASDLVMYGNDVISRRNYITIGGRKSWIISQHPLPAGILKEFHFYLHNNTGSDTEVPIRLQIWRPAEESGGYELVYDREVLVDSTSPAGLYYIVSTQSETFQVEAGDVIGWSINQEAGVISLSYTETGQTHFRNIQDYPTVEEIYQFDIIPLPAEFSMAVTILQAGTSTASTPRNIDSYQQTTYDVRIKRADNKNKVMPERALPGHPSSPLTLKVRNMSKARMQISLGEGSGVRSVNTSQLCVHTSHQAKTVRLEYRGASGRLWSRSKVAANVNCFNHVQAGVQIINLTFEKKPSKKTINVWDIRMTACEDEP